MVQDWREIVTYFSYPVKARDYSRWPDKPAAWRAVVERYSEQLMDLSCKLLGVLSEAMGLETDALAKACVDMDQKVVVNFYPRCPQPDLTLGLKRHTDPGTITLLLQDLVGGLQATRDSGLDHRAARGGRLRRQPRRPRPRELSPFVRLPFATAAGPGSPFAVC